MYVGVGQGEGVEPQPVPINPSSPTYSCTNHPQEPNKLEGATVENGVSTREAEFPLAEGVGGKFDNTLEMAGRVPGKLKLSPGLNFSARNLNSPCPLA